MSFYRDLFTGELKERPAAADGRLTLYVEEIPPHMQQQRTGSVWGRPWVSEAMSVHPDQVADFNEAAKRNGTGAHYRPDGKLECNSRKSRALETKARGMFDKDGMYGDYTGSSRAA